MSSIGMSYLLSKIYLFASLACIIDHVDSGIKLDNDVFAIFKIW